MALESVAISSSISSSSSSEKELKRSERVMGFFSVFRDASELAGKRMGMETGVDGGGLDVEDLTGVVVVEGGTGVVDR